MNQGHCSTCECGTEFSAGFYSEKTYGTKNYWSMDGSTGLKGPRFFASNYRFFPENLNVRKTAQIV